MLASLILSAIGAFGGLYAAWIAHRYLRRLPRDSR